MTRSFHHLLTAALALVLAAVPCAATAQEVVQPLPGTTDADKLGDMMRRLATNPRDVDALIRAGDLSMGLGDLSGAAALFARAEKVNPRDGRVKAGMASILVRSERPGEALRYYAQAESLGLDPRNFAADRGLAFDLIGQQDRAQRDYRVALRDTADDETLRRYALSLGISGKQDLALQQLAPLLQKSDRGAWRARAFIMAMNGDVAGAEKIATTMMPSGTAQGLQPFFQRLPNLPAADRAFAVHFGEVHATPARLADARMTPPLPALAADPTAPVMLAAVAQPQGVAAVSAKTKRDRKPKPGRTEMAATSVPAKTDATVVAPPRGAPVQVASAPMRMVQPAPVQSVLAKSSPVSAVPTAATPQPAYRAPQTATQLASAAPADRAMPTSASPPAAIARAPVSNAADTPAASTAAPRLASAAPATSPTVPAGNDPTRSANALAASASLPVAQAPATSVASAASTPSVIPAPVTPPVAIASATSEDSILARIIAGLSIPAAELDVAPMRAAPAAVPASVPVAAETEQVLADAKAKAARDLAAKTLAAEKKAAADKKIADRKAVADKKALAAKKAAAAEKAIADKKAAEEKRIARANPERIWVQVSTGATEGDLPKAWKNAKAKAPAVFGSRAGWTVPWKATNRVLAGPFKTAAEARTFVNQLAKEGVSTFSFTSDAGQVISKLPAK